MRPRFIAAYAGLALALVLLAPALVPLSGSMDAFSRDLANGTFRPFGQMGNGSTPALAYSGTLGGFTGDSGGNYLPGSGEVPPQWAMDRDGRAGRVVIDEVFDPGLGAMKRLKAYDRVAADGQTLEVADPQLRPLVADPTLQYSRFLEASFLVQFHAGEAIPIYSPHPKAILESFRTDPPLPGSVRFFRDGADTLHALAQVDRVARLNLTFRVSQDYYSFTAPEGSRVSDYRYGAGLQKPVLPAALQREAATVLARAGVQDPGDVRGTVEALAAYFRSFTEGDIPPPTEVESLYLALALGEKGCCRHRAFAFLVTAQSVGIPTRAVVNEAHAFVEVATPDGHWHQINLGGCGTYQLNNPNNYPSLFDQARDPRREANPDEGLEFPRVLTFTNITDSPERIVKGQTFVVNGTVQASDGRGVPGARIDVYLNETKDATGKHAGAGTTGSDGRFSVVGRVPATVPARGYQLVAKSSDGQVTTTRYTESWSDPPVEVFAPTRFVATTVNAAAGFPANVTVRLVDLDGNGVPLASVSWTADGAPQGELRTDAGGRLVARVTFDEPGAHVVAFRFDGTTHHGPSSAVVNVTAARGAILLPAEPPVLVRGESGSIGGQVVIRGTRADGRSVQGDDSMLLGPVPALDRVGPRTVTDEDGGFLLPLRPDEDLAPGPYLVRILVPDLALQANATVRVAARPTFVVDATRTLGPGSPLVIVASLASDNGTALPGAIVEVVLDGNASSTRALLTNRTGVARFEIPSGGLARGAHSVRVSFPGDAAHVEAARSLPFTVEVPWYASVPGWLYAAVLAVLAAVLLGLPFARRDSPARHKVALWAARVHRPERRFLSFAFPDHPAGVPPVFAPGERARIVVLVHDRAGTRVGARVGLTAGSARLASSEGSFEVDVGAGPALRLRAHATGVARLWTRPLERSVPVVTYREAVEQGFVALRSRAKLRPASTPGDVVARLERKLPEPARSDLRWAAELFVVADYSERPVDRAFYHAFARAAASVTGELEEVVDAAR